MHDAFDPYQQWLGIPPSEQPVTHYRLLGLRLFESDARIIAHAVQLRFDHVRSCDDGQHPEAVERLLEHVAAARDTLRNPRLKAQYDEMLARKQARSGPPSPASAVASPSVSAPPVEHAQAAANATSRPDQHAMPTVSVVTNGAPKTTPSRTPPTLLIFTGALTGLAVLLGFAVWIAFNDRWAATPLPTNLPAKLDEPLVADSADRTDRPDRPRPPSSKLPRSEPSPGSQLPAVEDDPVAPSRPLTPRRPRGPETMADLMGQPDDGTIDMNTVTGKLSAARLGMASRNLLAARTHVESAARAARTPTERLAVTRVQKLLGSLETFWDAVRQAAQRLESGEELLFGDAMIMVVEWEDDRLTVRAVGQNRSYTMETMPSQLAVVLAERRLPRGQPSTDLHIGSFLAIDSRGDRHEARTRWQRAGSEGQALMPELSLAPPTEVAQFDDSPRDGEPVSVSP